MDAVYILTPEPHIVDCLLADFDRRRYRTAYLVWTSLIEPGLRRRIDEVPGIRQLRASSRTLFVDFFPRESHLVTFRDPWSFPMLYHPACNSLVPAHMQMLAQKVSRNKAKAAESRLIFWADCWRLHYFGRVSQGSILQARQCSPRG
jgi:syntaxin-binding protein 1